MRDSEPMAVTNYMAEKPCLVIIVTFIVLFILGGISY